MVHKHNISVSAQDILLDVIMETYPGFYKTNESETEVLTQAVFLSSVGGCQRLTATDASF